ncbi:uncharacterized protein VSU04_017403 [Chlamydotis macqueenii]
MVDLESASSVCSSACGPLCFWPWPSWDVLHTASKSLAKNASPDAGSCPGPDGEEIFHKPGILQGLCSMKPQERTHKAKCKSLVSATQRKASQEILSPTRQSNTDCYSDGKGQQCKRCSCHLDQQAVHRGLSS